MADAGAQSAPSEVLAPGAALPPRAPRAAPRGGGAAADADADDSEDDSGGDGSFLAEWRRSRRASALSREGGAGSSSRAAPPALRRGSSALSAASFASYASQHGSQHAPATPATQSQHSVGQGQQPGDATSVVSEALSHSSSLGWRLREEADLVRQQWCWIVTNTVVLVYGTMFVLLNLAFLRFPVAVSPLKDLGHELVPELPERVRDGGLVELPQQALFLITAVFCIALFVNNSPISGKRNPKPHLINVVLRVTTVYSAGHVLRAGTYLATSPPGSADRCLRAGDPDQYRPTLVECFYIAADVYHNCGDLMFSGHMLLCLLLTLAVLRYGEAAFWIARRHNMVLVAVCLALCVAQSYLILAARHHYTSDVVVAWYVTPLLWYYFNTAVYPRDLKPDIVAIAHHVLQHKHVEHVESLEGAALAAPLLAAENMSGQAGGGDSGGDGGSGTSTGTTTASTNTNSTTNGSSRDAGVAPVPGP